MLTGAQRIAPISRAFGNSVVNGINPCPVTARAIRASWMCAVSCFMRDSLSVVAVLSHSQRDGH
jgi:hypothetical protein